MTEFYKKEEKDAKVMETVMEEVNNDLSELYEEEESKSVRKEL